MPRAILAIGSGEFELGSRSLNPLPSAPRDATHLFKAFVDSSMGAANAGSPSRLLLNPTCSELLGALRLFLTATTAGRLDPILCFCGHAQPLRAGGWGFFCHDSDP